MCLWDARLPLGSPDGGVCSAWWTEVLPPFTGRIWTRLWSRLYNEKAMDSHWVTLRVAYDLKMLLRPYPEEKSTS